jgi:hypothetical protein
MMVVPVAKVLAMSATSGVASHGRAPSQARSGGRSLSALAASRGRFANAALPGLR